LNGIRFQDRLINLGLLAACGLLIVGTIVTLIFVKFSAINLVALIVIGSYAGSTVTLLYWYRLENEQKDGASITADNERRRASYQSNHLLHQFETSEMTRNIIFNTNYDISFYKLENLHAFDCKKWGKIAKRLEDHFRLINSRKKCGIKFISPTHPINDDELSLVHPQTFLTKINSCKFTIIRATEVALLCAIPMCLIRRHLLIPLRWQTAGTVLAGFVAIKRGWAINLGGGFHHCSATSAGGFCLFADITLSIKYLWKHVNSDMKVIIVDLDAHQGNGHARDVLSMNRKDRNKVYIMDMFNGSIYPGDEVAKEGISRMIVLKSYTGDENYLQLLRFHLNEALNEFSADFIVYNAGTDILRGDPLGALNISPEGVKQRDEFVFTVAKQRNIPIVMLTSGGYQMNNAEVIANSIINLFAKNIIS
ncbi:hypothetical protein B4U80_02356, partial [Leptotrombidium deliense]